MKIAEVVKSYKQKCGIAHNSRRWKEVFEKYGAQVEECIILPLEKPDIILYHYEPGLFQDNEDFNWRLEILKKHYPDVPITFLVHNVIGMERFTKYADGLIFYNKIQIENKQIPNKYLVLGYHPGVYYPPKNKEELRQKFGYPLDKTILMTSGFATAGRLNRKLIQGFADNIKDNELVIFNTTQWMQKARFIPIQHPNIITRHDISFTDEELYYNLQSADLLFLWVPVPKEYRVDQSGIAGDMYTTGVKMIVKNIPHYAGILDDPKVVAGSDDPYQFAIDALNLARDKNALKDTQNPKKKTYDTLVNKFLNFLQEVIDEHKNSK